MTLTNTYISSTHTLTYTQMCRWVGIFLNWHDPFEMTLLAPGRGCHLDFSPKNCAYPTLVTTDPLEVKIISFLLYKNNNCPTLFCTFTIDNSSFLTTVKKKMFCVSLLSVKKFLIHKFNGCTVCLAKLAFMIPYLSHLGVTVWRRPDLLNACNIWPWNYKIMLQILN